MGIKYLWDSNTAIYYLQKLFPNNAQQYIDDLLKTDVPVFSVITEIELLSWKTATSQDIQVIEEFLSDSIIIELEPAIKRMTAELRRKHKIKLPDAVIAATSLVYGLKLLTRNINDFKDIDGLQIINPWDEL